MARIVKEIAPSVTRAAVLREPSPTAGVGQFAVIQILARSLGLDVTQLTCATPAKSSEA